jgi:hypothetical protein
MTWMDDEEEGTFEVVDELVFDEVVDEGPAPAAVDAFARLVVRMVESAQACGASLAAIRILRAVLGMERLEGAELGAVTADALVTGGLAWRGEGGISRSDGFAREVLAWQGVLRGESEDFSGCSPLALDEWCANVVSRSMGESGCAEAIRRDLRRRGVAAFGLMEGAAA